VVHQDNGLPAHRYSLPQLKQSRVVETVRDQDLDRIGDAVSAGFERHGSIQLSAF
jgi:hypothetical protein